MLNYCATLMHNYTSCCVDNFRKAKCTFGLLFEVLVSWLCVKKFFWNINSLSGEDHPAKLLNGSFSIKQLLSFRDFLNGKLHLEKLECYYYFSIIMMTSRQNIMETYRRGIGIEKEGKECLKIIWISCSSIF